MRIKLGSALSKLVWRSYLMLWLVNSSLFVLFMLGLTYFYDIPQELAASVLDNGFWGIVLFMVALMTISQLCTIGMVLRIIRRLYD